MYSDFPINGEEAAELKRLRASEPDAGDAAEAAAPLPPPAEITRDDALLRLADRLPEGVSASVHLQEVALANRDVAADLRAGKPARFFREWTVLITAPGYQQSHPGAQLAEVVERALAEYFDWRADEDAEDWARAAIPDETKPPKLSAPGTADARQQQRQRDEHQRGAG
jgi:hypothetical protein